MFFFSGKFLKTVLTFLIVVVTIFVFPVNVFAEGEMELSSPSVLLMEPVTGKVLYEKNPYEKRSCASITKIMTLVLVMEALGSGKISLTDSVIVSEHAKSMGGSNIWLETGESMSVDEMIRAVVIASANDAAVALAEFLSGTEDVFVAQMNQRAGELGMENTVFKNCNGLDEDGHLTCAYDVALMSRELIKHKGIFDYTSIWIDYLRDGKTQLVNTNKLLKSYKGITGLKTGTTDDAGCCISATATRDKVSLIAVVLGGKTSKDRFSDAAVLLDYGFANYAMVTPATVSEEWLKPVAVKNGMSGSVELDVKGLQDMLIKKGSEKSITSSVEIVNEVEAPVNKGQVLGKLIYKTNDEVIAEYDITAKEPIDEINFAKALKRLFKVFLRL